MAEPTRQSNGVEPNADHNNSIDSTTPIATNESITAVTLTTAGNSTEAKNENVTNSTTTSNHVEMAAASDLSATFNTFLQSLTANQQSIIDRFNQMENKMNQLEEKKAKLIQMIELKKKKKEEGGGGGRSETTIRNTRTTPSF